MSAVQEKKFVMKHVFTDVMNMTESEDCYGKKEKHFNVPWAISIFMSTANIHIYFECMKTSETEDWSIETEIELKLFKKDSENSYVSKNFHQECCEEGNELKVMYSDELEDYLVDGNLTVECHVKITKTTGIEWKKLRSFDESMKEYSNIVLILFISGGLTYLASHSPYFKSLFMGNFDESKQSEITLNDIDPYDFQNFLEVLHGEPAIDDEHVEGILYLAGIYDSKTAIRRCEKFLIEISKKLLKEKFGAAIKYEMDILRKKCIADIKTKEDIKSVFPKDVNQLKPSVWAELLEKSISLE